MSLISFIWNAPRPLKRTISVIVDVLFITIAYWSAYWTRLGDSEAFFVNYGYQVSFLITLVLTILLFVQVGLYRAILRYMNVQALLVLFFSAGLSSVIVIFSSYFTHAAIPRSIPVIYGAYLAILCGGARLIVRAMINRTGQKQKANVIIYGAGSAGLQLANVLHQGTEYHPVCFIDDDKSLHRNSVHGLTIYRRKYLERQISKYNVKKVLLAMPSATRSERKAIVESLINLPVEVLSIPDLNDIANGKASIDQLHDVAIEDLLGRDPVSPDTALLSMNTTDKVVMVTGAGGSIGSELCRQILLQSPRKLILFELSEFGLYQIERELSDLEQANQIECEIIPVLGSVQRPQRLQSVMEVFSVETVYHAAAYKHVPLVEYNVIEGIRNNVFGTYYCARAAINAGVKSFVLISTDKAVRPTNIMGTTKRLAELSLQALAEKELASTDGTKFCMVRFGNVLGSSGSVIPVFKKQIKEGKPITVTHPDIIRYFMTIPEAAQLVIQAGAMGRGGDVFVLDMGEPVKIVDLAKSLIRLSGLEVKSESNPHGDVEISFTGLRPGEKLFEELLIGDNVTQTQHPRIMAANEESMSFLEFEEYLDRLDKACLETDYSAIRQLLLDAPTGFNPVDDICDLVWKEGLKA